MSSCQLRIKILAALATVVCLVGFQNCSSGGSGADDQAAGGGENGVSVAVLQSSDGDCLQIPCQVQGYLTPISIEFFEQSLAQSNSNYLFTLNVQTGAVENQSQDVVYTISLSQVAQLQSILTNAVYADYIEIEQLQGITGPYMAFDCPAMLPDPTHGAVIETSAGALLPLTGECGGYDLFNLTTYQDADIASFLTDVSEEVVQSVGIGIVSQTTFSDSPATGVAPLMVGFAMSNLENGSSYAIDFGDGTIGAVTQLYPPCAVGVACPINGSASHTYQGAGVYIATLLQEPTNANCACTTNPCPMQTECTVEASQVVGALTITVTNP